MQRGHQHSKDCQLFATHPDKQPIHCGQLRATRATKAPKAGCEGIAEGIPDNQKQETLLGRSGPEQGPERGSGKCLSGSLPPGHGHDTLVRADVIMSVLRLDF